MGKLCCAEPEWAEKGTLFQIQNSRPGGDRRGRKANVSCCKYAAYMTHSLQLRVVPEHCCRPSILRRTFRDLAVVHVFGACAGQSTTNTGCRRPLVLVDNLLRTGRIALHISRMRRRSRSASEGAIRSLGSGIASTLREPQEPARSISFSTNEVQSLSVFGQRCQITETLVSQGLARHWAQADGFDQTLLGR